MAVLTGDLFAKPSRESSQADHFRLSAAEALSMWAFVEEDGKAFPLLSRLHRSGYGPEFELDRSGQDALLGELASLEARLRDRTQHSGASGPLPAIGSFFEEKVSKGEIPSLSSATAMQAIERMKRFIRDSETKGWFVYNRTE